MKKNGLIFILAAIPSLLVVFLFYYTTAKPYRLREPAEIVLPPALHALNKEFPLPLISPAPFNAYKLGNKSLITIRGNKLFTRHQPILETHSGYNTIFRSYIGVTYEHWKSLKKRGKSPMFDTTESNFPGFFLSGKTDQLAVTAAEPDVQIHYARQANEGAWHRLYKHAFITNKFYTLHIWREKTDKRNDQLVIDVYKHATLDSGSLAYFLLESEKPEELLNSGRVIEQNYPLYHSKLWTIQALNASLKKCNLLKKNKKEWIYASPYQYVGRELVNQQFADALSSEHCRATLAALYQTPAGIALKKRISSENQKYTPLVAIGASPYLRILSLSPTRLISKKLSTYQHLLYQHSSEENIIWHQAQATEKIKVSLSAPDGMAEIYIYAKNIEIKGAKILEKRSVCPHGLCNNTEDLVYLKLKPHPGKQIILTLYSHHKNGSQQKNDRLVSRIAPDLTAPPQAHEYKLVPGDDHKHNHRDSVVLDRKGRTVSTRQLAHIVTGLKQVAKRRAVTTIDLELHTKLQQLIKNETEANTLEYNTVSLTVLNGRGEILAAPQLPYVAGQQNYQRLFYEASWKPRNNPITNFAGFHDGSSHYTSGSTIKLITAALLVDRLGLNHPLIIGLPLSEWDKDNQLKIDSKYPCFPVMKTSRSKACSRGAIRNFAYRGVRDTMFNRAKKHKDNTYGLDQALRDSLNTYFAGLADQFLIDPVIPSTALEKYSISLSPLRALATELGFYAPMNLSGGVLNQQQTRQTLLSVPASRFHNYLNPGQYWRAVVGEQTTVSPLQIAQMTLAFANQGSYVPVSLIRQLDGIKASYPIQKLSVNPISILRVNKAMAYAANAKMAFAGAPYQAFLKSGTGERGDKTNNGWLTGFVYTEKSQNPFVVTCAVMGTKTTGSRACGEIVRKTMDILTGAGAIPGKE